MAATIPILFGSTNMLINWKKFYSKDVIHIILRVIMKSTVFQIPLDEIYHPNEDKGDDVNVPKPRFRGHTIGNGQVQRRRTQVRILQVYKLNKS